MKPWDVAVVGGGILGTTFAYWLSSRYNGRIAVYEQEQDVARHASSRNTGVIHRPFYLHPERSRHFVETSRASYDLWKAYAELRNLPWKQVGTLKLALEEDEVPRLEEYLEWSGANGLAEDEVVFLGPSEVRELEPNVVCVGAVHATKETAVDFGAFTRELRKDAEGWGARFLFRRRVESIAVTDSGVEIHVEGTDYPHQARFVVNVAGGRALDLAHGMGVATMYADLHFRGEYWRVAPPAFDLSRRNLYTVPRYPEFPFLDPHWIVEATGEVEIGPSAVPVDGPETYRGFSKNLRSLGEKVWEPPLENKARLLVNPTFLQLALGETLGSISKRFLAERVQRFLPALKDRMLTVRGIAGVRSSLVDRRGGFLREIVELKGPSSVHILNYNSPGATGAPAYTSFLLNRLRDDGHLAHLRQRENRVRSFWSFDSVAESIC